MPVPRERIKVDTFFGIVHLLQDYYPPSLLFLLLSKIRNKISIAMITDKKETMF